MKDGDASAKIEAQGYNIKSCHAGTPPRLTFGEKPPQYPLFSRGPLLQ